MLKKLMKHEFFALSRKYVIFLLILILATGFYLLVQLLPGKGTMLNICRSFMDIVYTVAVLTVLIGGFFYPVIRFYQNMVTGEGYLTFTLPVKIWQLTLSKLLVGALLFLLTLAVTVGTLLLTAMSNKDGLLANVVEMIRHEITKEPIIIVGSIFFAIVFVLFQLVMFYLSISFGQRFNENKAVGAVFTYFVLYLAIELILLATVGVCILIFGFAKLDDYFGTREGMRVVFCASAVLMIGLGSVCYRFTNEVLKKKLNLE